MGDMQARTIDAAAAAAPAVAVAGKSSSSLGRFGTAVLFKKVFIFVYLTCGKSQCLLLASAQASFWAWLRSFRRRRTNPLAAAASLTHQGPTPFFNFLKISIWGNELMNNYYSEV